VVYMNLVEMEKFGFSQKVKLNLKKTNQHTI
jgi:hypothetical protein